MSTGVSVIHVVRHGEIAWSRAATGIALRFDSVSSSFAGGRCPGKRQADGEVALLVHRMPAAGHFHTRFE